MSIIKSFLFKFVTEDMLDKIFYTIKVIFWTSITWIIVITILWFWLVRNFVEVIIK